MNIYFIIELKYLYYFHCSLLNVGFRNISAISTDVLLECFNYRYV